ncbi:hypothetical protein [Streptomyces sp. NPDC093225]|uniref:hypothetical protein n=1 Tax=Streptomyces sp. NPDC093225 TaxID=3366034 RepID=UPI003822A253
MRRRMVAGIATGAFAVSLALLPAVSASASSVSTAPANHRWERCDDSRHVNDWRWWNDCCNRDWNDRPSWCWDDDHGNRNDNRYDDRYDSRYDNRNDNRYDNRNDNRGDNHGDNYGDNHDNGNRNDGR